MEHRWRDLSLIRVTLCTILDLDAFSRASLAAFRVGQRLPPDHRVVPPGRFVDVEMPRYLQTSKESVPHATRRASKADLGALNIHRGNCRSGSRS